MENKQNKRAQQEMIGFVLIVVIVTIAAVVFLVISLRNKPAEQQNVEVENMLTAMFTYTTECAISNDDYDDLEDLLKSCYDNKKCENNGKMACDYLEGLLKEIMPDLIKTESQINYYELQAFHRTLEGANSRNIIKTLVNENMKCSGKIMSAQKNIAVDSGSLIVRLSFCYGD